jgi:hypothetical protein
MRPQDIVVVPEMVEVELVWPQDEVAAHGVVDDETARRGLVDDERRDQPCDEPRDVPRHPDARWSSRRRA